MAGIPLRLIGRTMLVPPFRLEKHGQAYVSRSELVVDLIALRPGVYRVVAVQNFHVEDRSPALDECAAGVFLAARAGHGGWEQPETFPAECRTLAVIGYLQVGRAPRVCTA
jgi:hypothetical protein